MLHALFKILLHGSLAVSLVQASSVAPDNALLQVEDESQLSFIQEIIDHDILMVPSGKEQTPALAPLMNNHEAGLQFGNDALSSLLKPTLNNDDIIIQIGDELQILLQEDDEFQFRGPVDDSGYVTLNYVGEIQAAYLSINEFKARLEQILLDSFYKKVTLTVSIPKQALGHVFVYGAVQEPGAIKLSGAGKISIPQTLAAVGGLTAWSDPNRAYIIRSNQGQDETNEPEPIDIRKSFNNFSKDEAMYLFAGDELFIPGINQSDSSQLLTNAPQEVIVVGQVNKPGMQKFAPGEDATLMRAILKAGGLNRFAQGSEVKLIRYQDEERSVQKVNASNIIEKGFLEDDVQLSTGDMIIVPQKFINF